MYSESPQLCLPLTVDNFREKHAVSVFKLDCLFKNHSDIAICTYIYIIHS